MSGSVEAPAGAPARPGPEPLRTPYPRWGLPAFFLGLGFFVLAELIGIVLQLVVGTSAPDLMVLVGYLLVWAAFLGALAIATLTGGRRSFVADFGLRFRWVDLPLGVVLGAAVAIGAGFLENWIVSTLGGAGYSNLPSRSEPTAWYIVNAVLGAAIIAPFVEELFFRGLFLRSLAHLVRGGLHRVRGREWDPSLQDPPRGRRIAAAIVSVGVSAVVFTSFHMLEADEPVDLLLLAAGTLPLGIVNGILAYRTGRLGPGILAHITFNAFALLP